jgi:hypothetical protein
MYQSRRERRNRERRASTLYLQFMDNRTGQLMGALADLSSGGFRLESTAPIHLHSQFTFRVDLPPGLCDRPFITFTARSVWSRTDVYDSRLYNTGFEITGILPRDAHALELLMERYAARTASVEMKKDYLWGR